MSTKTLRKRIALVAVAALGAGVLSVAPANANTLAVGNWDFRAAALQPGVCSVTNTDAAGTTVATVVTGSSFTLEDSRTINATYMSVTGATVASATSDFTAVTLTTATSATSSGTSTITFRAGAVGTAKITIKAAVSDASATDILTVTIVAACANNVFSAAKSFIQVRDDSGAADSNLDEATGLVRQNTETAYVAVLLKDAYGAALSGSGTMVATATNGAIVKWESAPDLETTSSFEGSRGGSAKEVHVMQGLANEDKPVTTTVTITLDGVVIGTKTISFQGVATKIVVTDVSVGRVGATTGTAVGHWSAVVQDAAGNNLYGKTVATDATANAAAASAVTASVTQDSISQDVVGLGAKPKAGATTNNSQNGIYQCTKSGTVTLFVQHVISAVAGATVKGSFTAACGGALDTWTISMDKATYAPGEIATLTVSGKDSKGFGVNSADTIGAVEYSFGGLTAVTAPTTTDAFDSAYGAKTYRFSVGVSEGSFVGTFKIAGATDTAAKTVQYKVANATGTVSNADVLKAIVSLIASINKQIAALQKALLRR